MSTPIAGWYPDPAPSNGGGPSMLRWWDGSAWSEHRRPAQDAAPSAAPTPAPRAASSAGAASTQYPEGSEYGGRTRFGSTPRPPAEQTASGPGSGQQRQFQQQPGQFQQQPGQFQQQPASAQPVPGPPVPPQSQSGQPLFSGARSPYTEHVMAVSQKRKLIELTNEYDIYGQDGAVIGRVVEVGQSGLKKAFRFLSDLDQFLTHTLEVRDSAGQLLMVLTRPAKIMKSTLVVSAPNGAEIGRLVQRNMFGRIRFGLEAAGGEVGSLNAKNWIAWDFQLQDQSGKPIGRITKTWEGMLTTVFTTADKYFVELDPNLQEPLKSLSIAAALCVDTALKQDSRGWN